MHWKKEYSIGVDTMDHQHVFGHMLAIENSGVLGLREWELAPSQLRYFQHPTGILRPMHMRYPS